MIDNSRSASAKLPASIKALIFVTFSIGNPPIDSP